VAAEIRRLHQQAGAGLTDITGKLGTQAAPQSIATRISPNRHREFGQHRRRGSVLDPWVPYILKRWEEGCRNGSKLYREIRQQGYSHSESNVGRLVAELRRSDGSTPDCSGRRRAASDTGARAPGTRHTSCRFSCAEQRSSRKNRRPILSGLGASDEAIGTAYELSQRFVEMIRDLDQRPRRRATGGVVSAGGVLRGSSLAAHTAASLKTDLAAVRAGLTESWNNGPLEGFIHKLKLVKRQGYGRANIDLLKARVMAA
jgi:transposase